MAAKPKMLIAEDSDTLSMVYKKMFEREFDVTLTRGRAEAFSIVDQQGPFDICIIDLIMPPEKKGADVMKTGIRLLRHIIGQEKSSRFLILTVRWDAEKQVKKAVGSRATYRLLLKQSTEPDEITKHVRALTAGCWLTRRPRGRQR